MPFGTDVKAACAAAAQRKPAARRGASAARGAARRCSGAHRSAPLRSAADASERVTHAGLIAAGWGSREARSSATSPRDRHLYRLQTRARRAPARLWRRKGAGSAMGRRCCRMRARSGAALRLFAVAAWLALAAAAGAAPGASPASCAADAAGDAAGAGCSSGGACGAGAAPSPPAPEALTAGLDAPRLSSEAVPDEWIVRFTQYKPAAEHRRVWYTRSRAQGPALALPSPQPRRSRATHAARVRAASHTRIISNPVASHRRFVPQGCAGGRLGSVHSARRRHRRRFCRMALDRAR